MIDGLPAPRRRSLPPARGRRGGAVGPGASPQIGGSGLGASKVLSQRFIDDFALGAANVGHDVGLAVEVLRHLLALRGDDPRLARLAAAAVLVVREGREGNKRPAEWSTVEMDVLRAEVLRLEAAWRDFASAVGKRAADSFFDESEARTAALSVAFREMEAAVRGGKSLPCRDELVVRVAGLLLGASFQCVAEVEAAVFARGDVSKATSVFQPSLTGLAATCAHAGAIRQAHELDWVPCRGGIAGA
eukprot:TRINITY_DN23757_c0_g2_i1.p1 TRINITY_DN23757_c0_g2~~TRINITY_DN23757_c0_g2_i1.p1  ORF type:complete len:246 (+),score=54.90 TRINITY_DN23757_c0_g2_i1:57-794(+)